MRRLNYDFILILITVGIMFLISILCIGGMFYFKWANLQSVTPAVKVAFEGDMNSLLAPLLVALFLTLGLCIPKRLLPTNWLQGFMAVLGIVAIGLYIVWGWREAVLWVLIISALLQVVVFFLVLIGRPLNFHYRGYWRRLGSSLIHLGLVIFCLDLFLLHHQALHIRIFWVSAICLFLGMIMAFYAKDIVLLLKRCIGLRSI